MELKDLMIDDWVYVNGKPYKVKMLYHDDYEMRDVIGEYADKEKVQITYLDEAEPIPLTVEILETNDFQLFPYSINHYIKCDGSNVIECYPRDSCWVYELGCSTNDGRVDVHLKFTYVHELQHILRVCDLDELADNFKISE